ncbi:PREDICTED: tetratricopeptide repeat protein 28 isoform X7 [Lepidothrix coronata]|uniref:Tetratricopeptide repeat protein 28 n=1 Tax=Lepidothrix coronata TaxID=321398 RepID=A0A6J0H653_9PASS|nr:PREDICTED: tetratricopeptide repeat protein 28 isoform X7 [Lepidothrix coronata]
MLSKAEFVEKVRQSNQACHDGDFHTAIVLYNEALGVDPQNCILYSNRSAAYMKIQQYDKALDDAIKARLLNPKWPKAYFRQGVALQYLGRHADALAAFASGLAQDPKSLQLLVGMVEAAMKSPMRESLEPTYQQLQKMKLDKSPFVVVSVIGQELLTAGHHGASVVVLEAALKIGTCSLKLRGSVFSALSSAYWSLGNTEKSTGYMQQDLDVAKSLGDQTGECRAHGNLGSAFFSKGNYREALTNHRHQLVLAMKLKDREAASSALSSLGHVYTAIGDYPNALASHKQCVLLAKQSKDELSEARELGNMGAVYIAMGDFENAVQCHEQHLKIAKELGNKREEARAYSNLGSAYHYRRNFDKAMSYHNYVLELAQELEEKAIEMRAYAGLGHAARCMQDLERAKQYHEEQLHIAESLQDRAAEGRASSNLGIIHQMKGDYDTALRLHKTHLSIAQELSDYAAQGRAYGNMGNAYNALGMYDQAVKYHRQELQISMEVNDRASQASTHGNLAVAYQALGAHDRALQHYQNHLNIARELRDIQSEARALSNLGNFHCSRGEYVQAAPYYEQYLRLSPELQDMEGEGKVCHNLGYAHYCLGNYEEAVKYYEQDLALAKDLHDKLSQAKAYCNLGLAFKALMDFSKAEECQKYLLSLAQSLNNSQAKFRALGNLGDIFVCKKDIHGAIKFYEQQLSLAHHVKDRRLEASAYAALGSAYRMVQKCDKALGYHTQELEVYQELGDMPGECRAHGHLAAVYMSLGKYTMAFKCYEEQLELGQKLKDPSIEAQVYGNMGITKMNMNVMEEAIGYFEQQLAMLQQLSGNESVLDRGRAYGNLGDCYEALGDFEEAIKYYEQYLSVAQSLNRMQDQAKAYRGLGSGHRAMGSLQQALVCFEKRLVVAHELGEAFNKAQAYGELGSLHSQLGNYEQAISCLERQLNIAREMKDRALESDAACGLGGVYQQMGEYETALQYHQLDLQIAEETNNPAGQGRAYGNLGLTYESLGTYERAVVYQEQHLSIAAQMNDLVAKTVSYSSLGRTHHALQNYSQAVMYLQEGLRLAEQLGRREDEAKIRHGLGLSLWASGNLEESQHQLYRASALFETIRHEVQLSTDYKLSLFDLQTSSYQALQRVLVSLGHHDEALAVAERGRTRAFADLLVERQTGQQDSDPYSPVTLDQVLETVNGQRGLVLYYSLAAGYLYSWLLAPGAGILKFHEYYLGDSLTENAGDFHEANSVTLQTLTNSALEQHISSVREALGVDSYYTRACASSETESEAGDIMDQQFEEMNNKLNSMTDPTGFLRMVSRNNMMNRSCQSMTSLFSSTMSPVKDGTSSLPRRQTSFTKPPLRALYDLLIGPMEGGLMHSSGPVGRHRQLILVLEGELYLIPFALLKGSSSNEYLYERFSLIAVPSIQSLNPSSKVEKSLQRIQNGQHNSMYTSQQSVENKVGGIPGWQALLTAVGFRLDPPASGLPAAVFFPTSDPGDRLQQCSTTIQSLLGLPNPALQALCKLITASETGEQLINRAVKNVVGMLHQVLVQLQAGEKEQDFSSAPIQVSISVQLWRLPGCHEFLAALGFDLCEVGQEEVILKTGKQATRRTMHFALQSLLALFDSTELPKRLSLDSSSSLESLASAQSVSNPVPHYQNPPFSPTCPDSIASDAISVYSLSSIASSMSFVSKPESMLDGVGHRGRQDYERPKNIYPHRSAAQSQLSPQATTAASKDEEEYEGFSIISNEPLGSYQENINPGFSPDHKQPKTGQTGGIKESVNSKGSISTPNSPVKMTLVPSPNSPFQKVGKLASSDTGESDQSSTETDSTVKSQEDSNPKLDPQELAQKILEETQSHLIAVERLQRSSSQISKSSNSDDGAPAPAGVSAFRSSETSAFSRPVSSSQRNQSSPLAIKPKPPTRSSSLQKVSSGYNSPTTSEMSNREGTGQYSGQPSPGCDSQGSLTEQPPFKLKYPSSPYSAHISKSPRNISPSSGHQSPGGSTPSPALSYSSAGSARSSPADAPDIDKLKLAAIDEKVQAIHNLKMFWQSTPHHSTGPVKILRGAPGTMTSKKDVLSLLNLSPRHSKEESAEKLELKDLSIEQHLAASPQKIPPNGHRHPETTNAVTSAHSPPPGSTAGAVRPLRLPAGNGYKFLSPGRFFPSSKC